MTVTLANYTWTELTEESEKYIRNLFISHFEHHNYNVNNYQNKQNYPTIKKSLFFEHNRTLHGSITIDVPDGIYYCDDDIQEVRIMNKQAVYVFRFLYVEQNPMPGCCYIYHRSPTTVYTYGIDYPIIENKADHTKPMMHLHTIIPNDLSLQIQISHIRDFFAYSGIHIVPQEIDGVQQPIEYDYVEVDDRRIPRIHNWKKMIKLIPNAQS